MPQNAQGHLKPPFNNKKMATHKENTHYPWVILVLRAFLVTIPPFSAHPQAMTSPHRARKRFGQNFLQNSRIINDIVHAVRPRADDTVIEIGPGLGALTEPLCAQLPQLHVIEIDRDLIARLQRQSFASKLIIHEGDVLQFDFQQIAGRKKIVGNLPYNISTPILFHLLPAAGHVQDQHFMLQKEVIDRMVASPCTGDYGRLSVMLQWRYAMQNVLFVPPGAFEPPPRVNSAVVRMCPREDAAPVPLDTLSELVQVAFSQRRKLLRHTLGQWLHTRGFAGHFDVQRRAEEVPVHEYVSLAQALAPQPAAGPAG